MSWSRSVWAVAALVALSPFSFAQSSSQDTALDQIKKDLADLRKENSDLRQRLNNLEITPAQKGNLDLEKEILQLNARFANTMDGGQGGAAVMKNTPMSLTGQIRERAEWRSQANGQDDFRILQRLTLGMDWMISDHLKAYASLRDARRFGDAATSELTTTIGTESTLDTSPEFNQAYLWMKDFMGVGADLKMGRQELVYGKERILSNADWTNTGVSFEGLRADSNWGDFTYSLLTMFVFNDGPKSATYNAQRLYGIYGNYAICPDHLKTEWYALLFHDDTTNTGAAGTGLHTQTYGMRAWGKMEMFDYEFEGATQTRPSKDDGGSVDFHEAYMLAGEAGLTMDDIDGKPRLAFNYDFGSDMWTDMFPNTHARWGQSDIIQNQTNLLHTALSLGMDVMDGWRFGAEYHWNRAFHQAGNDDLGPELDFTLKGKCGDHIWVNLSGGRNWGGDGLNTWQTTNGNAVWSTPAAGDKGINTTFAYIQFTVPF